jgi:hypothetical protein
MLGVAAQNNRPGRPSGLTAVLSDCTPSELPNKRRVRARLLHALVEPKSNWRLRWMNELRP